MHLMYKLISCQSFDLVLCSLREQHDYEVVREVGHGKYSEVYEGANVNSKGEVHHQDPQAC